VDCAGCPLRSQCIGKSDFKKIEDTVNKPLYDRMHVKLQTQKAKRMKKLRSSTVEPVLGTLVNFLGMRRVNTRGIAQANKCMLMAAIAYNLKKFLKFTARKVQTNVQAMQVNLQALFLSKISLNKPLYFLSAPLYLKQNS
jgi:heterodisulfide reductase subunit B